MTDFAERLRSEIEYKGLSQKEVASKAGIKKRALDMYVGSQSSMPPADVAVKIAQVLDVSVEYLVTGTELKSPQKQKQQKQTESITQRKSKNILPELEKLSFRDISELEPYLIALIRLKQNKGAK